MYLGSLTGDKKNLLITLTSVIPQTAKGSTTAAPEGIVNSPKPKTYFEVFIT